SATASASTAATPPPPASSIPSRTSPAWRFTFSAGRFRSRWRCRWSPFSWGGSSDGGGSLGGSSPPSRSAMRPISTPASPSGPAYYLEPLPALPLLAARGVPRAGELGVALARRLGAARPGRAALGPALVLAAFCACSFVFYLPRQVQLYTNYAAIPQSGPLDTAALGGLPERSLVLTRDWWPVHALLARPNLPPLDCGRIYAYAPASEKPAA